MANEHFDQLKVDVGLVKMEECTAKENSDYSEMEKNGHPLPKEVCRTYNGDYCRLLPKVSEDKEELYLLMRISKDLHFIKVLFQVLLILSIIIFVLSILLNR